MIKPALALAAAAVSLIAAPAIADETASRGDAKLAEILEGRVAGEPQRCINTPGTRNLQQIDGTALVYRGSGTIWVNYTENPESIDESDILVIERFSGSQLCSSDQVTLARRFGGQFSGILVLGEFVPYRLPETDG